LDADKKNVAYATFFLSFFYSLVLLWFWSYSYSLFSYYFYYRSRL